MPVTPFKIEVPDSVLDDLEGTVGAYAVAG